MRRVGNGSRAAELIAFKSLGGDLETNASTASVIRFDSFELDIRNRELRRNGQVVHLGPLDFDVLALLVRQPNILLTHQEISERLWPDESGDTYSILRVHIRNIRRALEDDPELPRYVETVPKMGYRFIGMVEVLDTSAAIRGQGLHKLPWFRNRLAHQPDLLALSVFLCHSSHDKKAVRDLHRKLLHDGFNPWLDEEKILPGQDWDYEIRKAVRSCDVVLVCLSKTSITKEGYVQHEIQQALNEAEAKPEGTIYLIPVKLEPCDTPDRLRRWQCLDLFSPGSSYEKLLEALGARARSRKAP